jgi:hypothetical protein
VLAHNLIHKLCAEHGCIAKYRGTIFEGPVLAPFSWNAYFLRSKKISLQIKGLSYSQISCAQSYPQKMCRRWAADLVAHPKFPRLPQVVHKLLVALFLSTASFPFKINDLSYCQICCTQSYPQNMCRTVNLWMSTVCTGADAVSAGTYRASGGRVGALSRFA